LSGAAILLISGASVAGLCCLHCCGCFPRCRRKNDIIAKDTQEEAKKMQRKTAEEKKEEAARRAGMIWYSDE
jgi:uncharacterized radical SAM superfamily Fe-S cluster-containing enzyme